MAADSANIRRMVVKTAVSRVNDRSIDSSRRSQMLGNLKTLPEPFGDVIRTHFRLKARSIAIQLDDWLSKDDGKPTSPDGGGYSVVGRGDTGGSSTGFQKDVEEMKTLLLQLEAGGASI